MHFLSCHIHFRIITFLVRFGLSELQSCRLEMNSTSDLARCTQLAQLIGALASSIQACRSIRP